MAPTRKLFATVALGAALLGGSVLSGCSNSITKEEFKKELTTAMKEDPQFKENPQLAQILNDKTITCMVDGLEKKGFKFRKYEIGGMSAEENTMIGTVTTECVTAAAAELTPTIPAG